MKYLKKSKKCKKCERFVFSFIETKNNLFYCHECHETLKDYLSIKRIVTSSIPDLAKVYLFKL